MKYFFLVIPLIIFIFISANFELWQNFRFTPVNTTYFGATGYFFDYYQFLSWMRDGRSGKILISSRYIPDIEKSVLLHPFFPILGLLSKISGFSIPVTYHLARNILLAVFLLCIYLLVRSIFKDRYKWTAFVLILVSSAVPKVSLEGGRLSLLPQIDFWQTFYFLEKFNIPAHHLLAKSLFLILIVLILHRPRNPSTSLGTPSEVSLVLTSILLVLINPASMTFMLAVLGIFTLTAGKWRIFILILIIVLPFMFYNYQVFNYGNPWKYYYLGEKVGRYMVSFWAYLGSLGPLFFTSLLSLFYLKKFRTSEKIMAVWNFLPIFMFPFVGRQIPFSMSRLFSLDLFIPSGVLTVFFFQNFFRFQRNQPSRLTRFTPVVGLALFALLLGVYYSITHVFSFKPQNLYNVFLPDDLIYATRYINNNSRRFSTILAGENISNLLPSLTDNHVVWGRLDIYGNYGEVEKQISAIYFREVFDREIINKLREWRVQYIIFGIDHVGYDRFVKKGKINGIEEVFRRGDVVVAEVF